MSTLLRLIRSPRIIDKTFLTFKDTKVNNVARRGISFSQHRRDDDDNRYKVRPDWSSYGFDEKDKRLDRHYMHLTMFCVISVALVGGAFVIAYMPDPWYSDWAQREAYLQLRYREEHGLPLIDPNVVDPSTFTLPTDEELGDTEIII